MSTTDLTRRRPTPFAARLLPALGALLSLLGSMAQADTPPRTTMVVVRVNEPFFRDPTDGDPTTTQPSVGSRGYRLVDERPGWVRVTPHTPQQPICGQARSALPGLDLPLWVRENSLQQVVTARVDKTWPDGSLVIHPGWPGSPSEQGELDKWLRSFLPAEAWGTRFVVGEAIPGPDGRQPVARAGDTILMLGGSERVVSQDRISRLPTIPAGIASGRDVLVTIDRGCVELAGQSGVELTAVSQGIGGLIGATGTQFGLGGLGSRRSTMVTIPAGSPLSWVDGADAGRAVDTITLMEVRKVRNRTCGQLVPGGLEICAPTSAAPPPQATPGSSSSLSAASASAGEAITMGALDRSLIDAVIQRKISQIRKCYQRELKHEPALGGKVTIKFTINKDGLVSQAGVKSTTLGNAAAEQCIVQHFYQMQFPQPKGGGVVVVSYPFIFSPG